MRASSAITALDQTQAYALSSELARACLPHATRDAERKFVWTAAIAALFLAVGIYGLFTRPVFTVPARGTAEDSIPVLFEPPQPQAVDNSSRPEPAEPDAKDTEPPPPAEVVAVANPAEAAFAVPVEGAVILAPARLASAPPIDLRAHATNSALRIPLFTGDGSGRYPSPTYPREALEHQLQGKLLLLVAVGANGAVSHVDIKESSGHLLLDQHAAEWVKVHWVWPPGENRLFYVPVIFELK
jgi:TonB family protein